MCIYIFAKWYYRKLSDSLRFTQFKTLYCFILYIRKPWRASEYRVKWKLVNANHDIPDYC